MAALTHDAASEWQPARSLRGATAAATTTMTILPERKVYNEVFVSSPEMRHTVPNLDDYQLSWLLQGIASHDQPCIALT